MDDFTDSGVAGIETVGQPGDWLTDNLPETADLTGPGSEYGLANGIDY